MFRGAAEMIGERGRVHRLVQRPEDLGAGLADEAVEPAVPIVRR
jgi:hypothetical protein